MTFAEYCYHHPRRAPTATLIMRRLERSPANAREVMAALKMSFSQTRRAIRCMRLAGLIHVTAWQRANKRNDAPWMPVWRAGEGKNEPKPKADPLEIDREYQRRKRERRKNERAVKTLSRTSLAADLLRLSK